MWFDSHCHLTSLRGAERPETDSSQRDLAAEAVASAAFSGVSRLLTVGCTVADSAQVVATAARFDNVWASAGVHPHDASQGIDGLSELLTKPGVVAVGECGLDYHYDHSPRDVQADMFVRQIELANSTGLSLVIHSREAWDDTFAILDREGMPARTIFHCFTGGVDEAQAAVQRGAYVSFSGIVTFGSADDVRAAALKAPANRILVETDSPYLAPVPHRGKPNRPANVAIVGRYLAELRGEPEADFARQTTANTIEALALTAAAGDDNAAAAGDDNAAAAGPG